MNPAPMTAVRMDWLRDSRRWSWRNKWVIGGYWLVQNRFWRMTNDEIRMTKECRNPNDEINPNDECPLTLTLSPEYGGEGRRGRRCDGEVVIPVVPPCWDRVGGELGDG